MRITLDYKTIILLDNPKEEEIFVKFMKIGESQIAYSTITRISEFKFTYKKGTEKDKFPTIESIEFDETNEFAEEQFEQIIDKSLHHLHHIITKKPIVYLHSGMKIPLQGLIFIGIFPLDRTNDASFTIHAIAAILFFIFTAISNLGFGYIEFKNSEFSKLFALISVIAGMFSAIFAIGFIFQEFSLLEDQPFIYLSEWIFFAFTTIWLIIHGIIFLKKGEN